MWRVKYFLYLILIYGRNWVTIRYDFHLEKEPEFLRDAGLKASFHLSQIFIKFVSY